MQGKLPLTNKTLNCKGKLVDLSTPKVMGILNVTPDSFYDGGRLTDEASILKQAERLLTEGATFVEVGGYSSRPGATDISEEEEVKRILPVVQSLSKYFPEAIISVDTFRSEVARHAINEGACIVNDISGGRLDSLMVETVAALGVPYILMHSRGTPQNMTQLTEYENLIKDVVDYFHQKVSNLQKAGVKDIIIDPGFGFAKNIEQNFQLLKHLGHFQILGNPLLVGLSRKSMVWKTLKANPENALNGTTALNTIALLKGASILRVHDVKEAVETIKLIGAIA